MTDLAHPPDHPLDRALPEVAAALRSGEVSATELLDEALRRRDAHDPPLEAYKHLDPDAARSMALRADGMLDAARRSAGDPAPPLCGIPVSVKDLYGVEGMPTFAGTPRELPPERWARDGWLVARLRAQGAVFTGKTHTVEMAFSGLGINPHWGTPRNPADPDVHRIPGGSSAGAGVSLREGSALVALGSDTGGSIRIPASMTGTVGQRTTKGRWPTDGVVPLSATMDTVGALTRTARDAAWFFGAIDPAEGDPDAFLRSLETRIPGGAGGAGPAGAATGAGDAAAVRVAVPRGGIRDACQADIAAVLHGALSALERAGWLLFEVDGALLDRAQRLYMEGGIPATECRAFLEEELPGWLDLLHPIVGERLRGAPAPDSPAYAAAMEERRELERQAPALFADADVLALPGHLLTPPPVSDLEEMGRYLEANATALRPTCPVSALGLCAVTIPVGRDDAGMPAGLQLVAPAGRDEVLLAVAVAAERAIP